MTERDIEIVLAYAEYNMSASELARKMFFHRNTVVNFNRCHHIVNFSTNESIMNSSDISSFKSTRLEYTMTSVRRTISISHSFIPPFLVF